MATIRDCKRIQPLLSEYVDGVLPEQDAWDVKLHVSSCSVCSQIAEDFTATARLLQAAPMPELSVNFEAMLARRLADVSLKPAPTTTLGRLREWWSEATTPRFPALGMGRSHAALATGVALAVLVPAAVFVTNLSAPRVGTITASPSPAVSGRVETASLDELFSEHKSYASSEPLSDPAGLLPGAGVNGQSL